MKTNFLHLCGAMALSALMLAACSKDASTPAPTPDPTPVEQGGASFGYSIRGIGATGHVNGETAARIANVTGNPDMAKGAGFDWTWTEATVRLREVRIEAKRGQDELEFGLKTDRNFDLLAAVNFIGFIKIPKGTYQRVLVYARAEGDKTKPLAILKGKITWNGTIIPLEARLSGKASIKATGKDIVVTDTTIQWKGELVLDFKAIIDKLKLGNITLTSGKAGGQQQPVLIEADLQNEGELRNTFENAMTVEHSHK